MTRTCADLDDETRWEALCARKADAGFFYGVLTTGIYCRLGCASRRPRRDNVRFFASADDATRAGLRPCRRCHPDAAAADLLIADACRRLEAADAPPLSTLIGTLGLGRRQFFARFKAATGMTPHGYLRHLRNERVRRALPGAPSITALARDAGFGSSAGFYDGWRREMTDAPGTLRRSAADTIVYGFASTSLGEVLAAATPGGMCAILIGEARPALIDDLRSRFPRATLVAAGKEFESVLAQVAAGVEAPRRAWTLPLDLRGTLFQQKVWTALREIPPGSTRSYTQLAAAIGHPGAVRAVAGACAANPLAVVVPCHRIVRADGDLSGYRWGVSRKRALLDRERPS